MHNNKDMKSKRYNLNVRIDESIKIMINNLRDVYNINISSFIKAKIKEKHHELNKR